MTRLANRVLASGGHGDRAPVTASAAQWFTPVDPASLPVVAEVVRSLVLVMVLVTVPLAKPHLGDGPHGTAIAVALAIAAVGWIAIQLSRRRPMVWTGALIVMAAAGGALAGLSSLSTAVAVGCVVTAAAGARLPMVPSVAIALETVAALLIAGLATGAPSQALIGWTACFIGLWAFGVTRRAYVLRADEAERALAQARRAQQAQAQAAALTERARIAREIHDVLAHSLAAVSVNLQAAEGLLAALPAGQPELAKAIECVERAEALTRSGMAETRRAILALRESDSENGSDKARDADGGARSAGAVGTAAPEDPAPGVAAEQTSASGPPDRLTERLRGLATGHRADGDTEVEFNVAGQPAALTTEAGLTVYRTVQEALTNARKHAPGQPVAVAVEYSAAELTVLVSNPLPPDDAERPLTDAGSGYGLTGLRERAELVGGTLTAGPEGGQWQVRLRIPDGTAQREAKRW